MITSTFFFAYYLTDSKLESFYGYGTKLYIQKPEYLVIMAWFAWLYFLIRYIQAFNEKASPIFREGYSRLLKKRYLETLGIDMDTISDFGFLDRMVVTLKKNRTKKSNGLRSSKFWKFSIKMKDPNDTIPYFIHHTSGVMKKSEARTLKRHVRIKAFIIYPHFFEYIFPLIYSLSLAIWIASTG